jgi:protease II
MAFSSYFPVLAEGSSAGGVLLGMVTNTLDLQ